MRFLGALQKLLYQIFDNLPASPQTPATGYTAFYFKSDGFPYIKNSAGAENALALSSTSGIDGGVPSSTYVTSQIINGGTP